MNKILSKVKGYSKNKWVLFGVGILLGGTVLAGLVVAVVSRAKALASKLPGASTAEKVAASLNPTK